MLNKSILLNLRIAKNDMATFLGLCITYIVLTLASLGGMFFLSFLLLPVGLVCYIVFYIRIANKVFFTSFFDDEGAMYMTLPISARDMVLGKVLAVSGFMTTILILLMTGLLAALFLTQGNSYDLLTALTEEMTLLEGSAPELALAFGLYPINTFSASLFCSSCLLAIFLKVGMKKKSRILCWVAYVIIFGIVNLGLDQIATVMGNLSFGSVISTLLSTVFYFGAAGLLIRYSVKNLEERYNV